MGLSFGQLVCQCDGRSVSCVVNLLVGRRLVVGPVGWLGGVSAGWSVSWLVGLSN